MAKLSPLVAALSTNDVFAGLGEDTLAAIADLCVSRTLADGETLFLKGDPGDALFCVRRGRILIIASTAGGKQLILNVLGSGDVFGEIALLDGRPRTADAVAGEPTEVLMIRRADFKDLLRRQPEIAVRLIELLCARLRWTSDRMEEASLLALPSRLARRLLKLAEDFGDEIEISQEELAILVGSARETVNRQLQVWRRTGAVELGRSRVRIVDRVQIERDAGAAAAEDD
ncbi:Crp/Fnr family transcriptional regulator [Chthonobacter rhizosphaerae]|uniref:Crp/Fnr family transcriptional regulator n=1 Tax=Chthonobacter rhizosphaerae TaxID=2735553 RepID=UPI0015EF1F26|nr:Crp/Fnr family transcriptional regulator [Chthonobacter rhizosphaerae]